MPEACNCFIISSCFWRKNTHNVLIAGISCKKSLTNFIFKHDVYKIYKRTFSRYQSYIWQSSMSHIYIYIYIYHVRVNMNVTKSIVFVFLKLSGHLHRLCYLNRLYILWIVYRHKSSFLLSVVLVVLEFSNTNIFWSALFLKSFDRMFLMHHASGV